MKDQKKINKLVKKLNEKLKDHGQQVKIERHIDWDQLPEWVCFSTIDRDGTIKWHSERPRLHVLDGVYESDGRCQIEQPVGYIISGPMIASHPHLVRYNPRMIPASLVAE